MRTVESQADSVSREPHSAIARQHTDHEQPGALDRAALSRDTERGRSDLPITPGCDDRRERAHKADGKQRQL